MWRGRSGHSRQRPPCVIAPGSYRLPASGDSQIRRTGRRRSVRLWLGEELLDDPGGGGEGLADGFEAVLEGAVQVPARLAQAQPTAFLPASMASWRRWSVNHWRTLSWACGVFTNSSQSLDGPASADAAVRTSTTSPSESAFASGTSWPLTRAPTQRCPVSVPRA